MKKMVFLLLFMLLLFGCSTNKSDEVKWVDSQEKAIKFGMKIENIKKNDILEIANLNDEKLIIFRFSVSDGQGINFAHLIKKNNKYQWYTDSARVILKPNNTNIGKLNVETTFKSVSGKKYKWYMGAVDQSTTIIDSKTGVHIKPKVDKETGMYYAFQPK